MARVKLRAADGLEASGSRRGEMQPKREPSPNKCKKNQTKSLVFPFIFLAEFGLFNGLQQKK
jgi:hypothetical protein